MEKEANFRFENRYPSRSAATLDLIRMGLEQLEKGRERQTAQEKDSPESCPDK